MHPGCSSLLAPVLLVAPALFAPGCSVSRPAESFATGVKIGEVGADRAVVWTRRTTVSADDPAAAADGEMRLLWWMEGDDGVRSSAWVPVTVAADGVHQFRLDALRPGTAYALEVHTRAGAGAPVDVLPASFTTAPPADADGPARFVVTTCQGYGRRDEGERGHRIYGSMLALEPDFFVHAGDVVYYDRDPKARDVAAARRKWHRMYALPLQREFHRVVPSYFIRDDHDTLKNDCWPGQTYGDITFERGLELFDEQVPSGPSPYRRVRWGRHLELWLLEGRAYRSPNRAPDGPDKTILGREQWDWLERTLAYSDATHRVVVSATPIVGPDRTAKADNHANRAFAHEGERLRALLAAHPGVVVVCGDRHWQYASVDPVTGLREFACGPSTDAHAGGFSEDRRTDAHRYLAVRGGFLSVSVEPRRDGGAAMTVRHHDTEGVVLHETVIEGALR
jgi:alkaline phosphatase D